jgi:hypothetical protein
VGADEKEKGKVNTPTLSKTESLAHPDSKAWPTRLISKKG